MTFIPVDEKKLRKLLADAGAVPMPLGTPGGPVWWFSSVEHRLLRRRIRALHRSVRALTGWTPPLRKPPSRRGRQIKRAPFRPG